MATKMIAGIVMVLIGLWLVLPVSYMGTGLWQELWSVVKGIVPITLIILGVLLVWVEAEEMKITRKRK